MRVGTQKRGRITVLDFAGNITEGAEAALFRKTFKGLLAAGETHFILDMTNVPFIDSTGLGEAIACHKRARERGGTIKLVLRGKTREMFTLVCLDRVFEIFNDTESALASFGPR